jgi:hypothetical protein
VDRKSKIGGVWFRMAWAKRETVPKITRAKRAGVMAPVVKHLPNKCEALSSNHSTTK